MELLYYFMEFPISIQYSDHIPEVGNWRRDSTRIKIL